MGVLQVSGRSSELQLGDAKPAVLLIVGVNGGGKTTTIGKLAHKFGNEGAKVGSSHGTSLRKHLRHSCSKPAVLLIVGMNGRGKTPPLASWRTNLAMKAPRQDPPLTPS